MHVKKTFFDVKDKWYLKHRGSSSYPRSDADLKGKTKIFLKIIQLNLSKADTLGTLTGVRFRQVMFMRL